MEKEMGIVEQRNEKNKFEQKHTIIDLASTTFYTSKNILYK